MSAYVVNPNHIAAIVGSVQHYARRAGTFENGLEVAETLVKENVRSVNYRYNEDRSDVALLVPTADQIARYRFQPLTVAALMKAIHCYDYQACEAPDYDRSEARQLCEIALKIASYALPGYEEALWEVTA